MQEARRDERPVDRMPITDEMTMGQVCGTLQQTEKDTKSIKEKWEIAKLYAGTKLVVSLTLSMTLSEFRRVFEIARTQMCDGSLYNQAFKSLVQAIETYNRRCEKRTLDIIVDVGSSGEHVVTFGTESESGIAVPCEGTLHNPVKLFRAGRDPATGTPSSRVVVVSGESGAGKTYFAVRRLRRVIFKEKTNSVAVFYAKPRSFLDGDLSPLLDTNERNHQARRFLANVWQAAVSRFQMREDRDPMVKGYKLAEVNVLLVLDEMGPFPVLLRGVIACWSDFETMVIGATDQGAPDRGAADQGAAVRLAPTPNNSSAPKPSAAATLVKCLANRLVCVGTAVDWAVMTMAQQQPNAKQDVGAQLHRSQPRPADQSAPDPGSDQDRFLLIRLTPWASDTLSSFWRFCFQIEFPTQDPRHVNITEWCLSFATSDNLFAAMGQNARCARFLALEILGLLQGRGALVAHKEVLMEILTSGRDIIFSRAAHCYLQCNGISDFQRNHPQNFKVIMMQSLQYAMAPAIIPADAENEVRRLLQYGVLSLDASNRVHMSPAMLLLTLSGFGVHRLPVHTGADFEDLVAMRAMAQILMKDPTATVRFFKLSAPIPHTQANNTCLRLSAVPQSVREAGYSCVNHLPHEQCRALKQACGMVSGASEDNNDDHHRDDSNKRKSKFESNHYDRATGHGSNEYMIFVNGPMAPGPDVIVTGPMGSRQRQLWLLQAKMAYKGWKPWGTSLMEEARKLGAIDANESLPATCKFLQLLARHCPTIKRQIVTSHGLQCNEQEQRQIMQEKVQAKLKDLAECLRRPIGSARGTASSDSAAASDNKHSSSSSRLPEKVCTIDLVTVEEVWQSLIIAPRRPPSSSKITNLTYMYDVDVPPMCICDFCVKERHHAASGKNKEYCEEPVGVCWRKHASI